MPGLLITHFRTILLSLTDDYLVVREISRTLMPAEGKLEFSPFPHTQQSPGHSFWAPGKVFVSSDYEMSFWKTFDKPSAWWCGNRVLPDDTMTGDGGWGMLRGLDVCSKTSWGYLKLSHLGWRCDKYWADSRTCISRTIRRPMRMGTKVSAWVCHKWCFAQIMNDLFI